MGVNKAILIGNLTKDPELKYTPSGSAVANFSIATNESWTNKDGSKGESATFHNIVVWNKLAEQCNAHLKKRSKAYIEGKIDNRSWDDKDGNRHYKTEIKAYTVELLPDGRSESTSDEPRKDKRLNPDRAKSQSEIFQEPDLPF